MKKIAPIGLLALGGEGDKLPSYSDTDAGKALTVNELGGLEWKKEKLYMHCFQCNYSGNVCSFSLVSKKSTSMTQNEVIPYLLAFVTASGAYTANGTIYIIYSMFSTGNDIRAMGVSAASTSTTHNTTLTWSKFTEKIVEI